MWLYPCVYSFLAESGSNLCTHVTHQFQHIVCQEIWQCQLAPAFTILPNVTVKPEVITAPVSYDGCLCQQWFLVNSQNPCHTSMTKKRSGNNTNVTCPLSISHLQNFNLLAVRSTKLHKIINTNIMLCIPVSDKIQNQNLKAERLQQMLIK